MAAVIMALAVLVGHEVPASVSARAQVLSVQPAKASQSTDLLPSLRAHMAELGTLMNFLFRHIDDPARAGELADIAEKMEGLLLAAGAFTPNVALLEMDPEKEATIMRGFQACLDRARGAVRDLRMSLTAGTGEAWRAQLLQLDEIRRDCHAAFG
ncbi:hypothetical protein [Bauldia sp.]|uniref:hypothetical protein n=1 Tax=Bauldia sp. TaxID=2575872 RepID=UPI003BA96FF9